MDIDIRELERQADSGDKAAITRYIAALLRSGEIVNIERQARLGDQRSMRYFLLALNFNRELNLDSLWVYPFTDLHNPSLVDYPIPFELGMTLNDIRRILIDELRYGLRIPATNEEAKNRIIGAWVIEDLSVELADKVSYDVSHWMEYRWPGHNIYIEGELSREALIEDIKWSIIRASSLFQINNRGSVFTPTHDLGSYFHHQSQSINIYRERASSANLRLPPNVERRMSPHSPLHIPLAPGGRGTRYKVVLHVPTGRAYSNDRSYALLETDVAPEIILRAMRYHNTIDVGEKATTMPHQEPGWSRSLPDAEFITYTVAD